MSNTFVGYVCTFLRLLPAKYSVLNHSVSGGSYIMVMVNSNSVTLKNGAQHNVFSVKLLYGNGRSVKNIYRKMRNI